MFEILKAIFESKKETSKKQKVTFENKNLILKTEGLGEVCSVILSNCCL